jgi:cardiolipin synthase
MTVGSSNLDPLSLLLAREANVVALCSPLSGQLLADLEQAMQNKSIRVALNEYANRPWIERVFGWGAYGLMRAALFVTGKRY